MLGDRIREARSIAKRYDQLDPYGKSLVELVIKHEAARIAASEPDEFEMCRSLRISCASCISFLPVFCPAGRADKVKPRVMP